MEQGIIKDLGGGVGRGLGKTRFLCTCLCGQSDDHTPGLRHRLYVSYKSVAKPLVPSLSTTTSTTVALKSHFCILLLVNFD